MYPEDSANEGQLAQIKTALPDRSDALRPVSIPDHQLIRCIGRGSYGEVWLARNIMGVYRAVKIVYRKSFESDRPFERELSGIRRFEPISRSHKGFIAVLHVGMNEEQGYFFYLMELGDDQVSGQTVDPQSYSPKTLAKEVSVQGRLPVKDALKLGLDLSEALAELHKQGLVHRDIKPSNIIFVNGIPKLADIGLVADVKEARSYVGTEGFIPPEGPGTSQADLFSLGKVLYEASTALDRHHFPDLPAQFEGFPDRDQFLELNDVIVQACQSNTAKRYRTAWDMHAHLLVVANGGSVKRLKLLERRLANLKRGATITVVAVLVLAAIGYQVYREWQRINEARQQKVGAYVANGINALESADLLEALPYFAEALDQDKADKDRQALHRLRFGSVLADCPRVVQMWFIPDEVMTAEFSPDGQHVLVAEFLSGKAEIFDLDRVQSITNQFAHTNRLRGAAYSADGNLFVTASEDHTACVWQASDGTLVKRLVHPDAVLSAHFSPDGSNIVTACLDKVARVWNWREGKVVPPLLAQHTEALLFAGFSPDGSRIVTGSRDETAQLWKADNHKPDGPPLRHYNWVVYAAFSPDGHALATCEYNKAHVWELASNMARPVHPDLAHQDRVQCVRFSPDGRWMLTSGLDNTARLWLVDNHQPPRPVAILRHSGRVMFASFDLNGHRIVSGCSDGTVRIWDLAGAENLPQPVPYSYSQDGTRFLAPTDNSLEVRDVLTGKALATFILPGVTLREMKLNRDGSFVLCSSISQTNATVFTRSLSVWDVSTGKSVGPGITLSNIDLPPNQDFAPVLSQSGKYLVTFSANKALLWDVRTGTNLS